MTANRAQIGLNKMDRKSLILSGVSFVIGLVVLVLALQPLGVLAAVLILFSALLSGLAVMYTNLAKNRNTLLLRSMQVLSMACSIGGIVLFIVTLAVQATTGEVPAYGGIFAHAQP